MAKEKIVDEKPKTKRGRKPKTTEVKTINEVVLEINDKINSDREMFFDVITQIRKRISDFERIHFVVLQYSILSELFLFLIVLLLDSVPLSLFEPLQVSFETIVLLSFNHPSQS